MRAHMDYLGQSCPPSLSKTMDNGKTICTKLTSNAGCSPMEFETFGFTFTSVCGYVL